MDKKYDNYEENLDKLKEILSELEKGELSLSDSVKRYEEALGLLKLCQEALSEAEMDISVLTDEGIREKTLMEDLSGDDGDEF